MNFNLTVKLILLLTLSLLWTGCIDENITQVSENIEITSGYSIPGGLLTYDINEYLEELNTFNIPWPDSLYYNDVLYPNYLTYLTRDDSKNFDFSQLSDNLDMVESVMFRLIISNGYPTEAVAQVYFADENMVYVDSAFADGPYRLQPAYTDNEGIVTAPYEEMVDIYMSSDFVDNMDRIRYIIIKSIIYTTRSDIRHVRFYTNYAFNVNISARIRLRFNTGDL
ncbi:MAG: hypothetical protein JXR41_05840 [Bacteroidales bacterium]|nr:hypothetical protein [Bacteroidales bacterium]MBN2762591.1 hypothetical protein [Bacteroidales bacterium]